MKEIVEFNLWCKKRNIQFYFTYPNHLRRDEQNQKRNEFFKSNDIKILGIYKDSFYDAKYFFDSRYHLNTLGIKLRRNKMIQTMIKEGVLR